MTLRDRIRQTIGGFVLYDDKGGPDTEVLHDRLTYGKADEQLEELTDQLLALLPALPPGEPTDDEVRDWAYNTLATDTDGDTRGVWWSTITPARKGMYRRAMLSARPSPRRLFGSASPTPTSGAHKATKHR